MKLASSTLSFCLFLSTLTLAGALPGRAFAGTPAADTEARFQLCSYTQDHVYFYTTGTPVDVTATIYTSQGQTYAVYQGNPVAITLDYVRGSVYDTQNNIIGFIWLISESPGSGTPHHAKGRVGKTSKRTLQYRLPARVPAPRKGQAKDVNRHLLASVPIRGGTQA